MGLPPLTDGELVGLNSAGSRVLSTASITRRLYERTRWLAEKKPTIHWGYGDGQDCEFVASTMGTSGVTVVQDEVQHLWTIGHAFVPAVGNDTGIVRLYIRQQEYASGTLRAGLAVRPNKLNDTFVQTPGPWIDLGTNSLGSSNGWRSGTFTIPEDIRDEPFEAKIYLTTWNGSVVSSVQTNVTAWSLCSEGTAWPRSASEKNGAHFRRSSGPPDDVFTLRLLRDMQDDSAAVPRILANHSFRAAPAAGADWICRYIIPAPIHATTLTIHVYCRTTGGSAATLYAACDTSDTTTDVAPASDGSTAFTSSTLAWRTVTVTPTAGVTNYLFVWVDPAVADTADVQAVYATQADPADGAVVKGAPCWRILPVGLRDAVPGAAIVNAYSAQAGGETPSSSESIQNLWTDRFASLNNAGWWPHARGAVTVPCDMVVSPNGSTAAYPGIASYGKVSARWAASSLTMAVRVSTNGIRLEDDEKLFIGLNSGITFATDRVIISPSSLGSDRFEQFGDGTLTPGTVQTPDISLGYVDTNGIGVTGTNPARIESIAAWERPPTQSPNAVHRREYLAVNTTIPDNDIVTGVSSSIVVSGRAFFLKTIRVHVVVTHGNAAQLKLTLTDGTTTRRLADFADLGGSGTQVFSFSDSYEEDTVPDQSLDAFAGVSTTDTWTLSAYDNAAGTVGTLVSWAIEFW